MSTVGSVARVVTLHESLMSMVLPVPVKAGNAKEDENRMTNDEIYFRDVDVLIQAQDTDCDDILPLNSPRPLA